MVQSLTDISTKFEKEKPISLLVKWIWKDGLTEMYLRIIWNRHREYFFRGVRLFKKWRQRKKCFKTRNGNGFSGQCPFRFHDCGGKHNVSNAYVDQKSQEK